MAENSNIEWTDHTFNPWIGCTKVSDGCKNCYAETLMDKRYKKVQWGSQGVRIRTSVANWKKPLAWNRQAEAEGRRFRVFCASLADVFESKPDQQGDLNQWRRDLGDLISATPYLDWLLLTKRPQSVNHLSQYMFADGLPDNVWIGTSIENQEQADKRIPELLKIPAAVRFLSMEPLLGPVDLHRYMEYANETDDCGLTDDGWAAEFDWVIVGGESGPNARMMSMTWVYNIIRQCQSGGVPVFVKQMGDNAYYAGDKVDWLGKKGNDIEKWPAVLQIREFPKDWLDEVVQ